MSKKILSLKVIYGFIFGSLTFMGLIYLFLFYKIIIFSSVGLAIAPLTGWARWVLLVCRLAIGVLSFLLVTLMISRGLTLGKRWQDRHGQKPSFYRQAYLRLTLVLVIFFIFISQVYKQYSTWLAEYNAFLQQERIRLGLLLPRTMSIGLSQAGPSLAINVDVAGSYRDQYALTIKISSVSTIFGDLIQFTETVPLIHKNQSFLFDIPFEQLSQAYHRELMKDNVDLNTEQEITEIIRIDASIRLKGTPRYLSQELDQFSLQEKLVSAFAYFNFSCLQDRCQIVQEGQPESPEEPERPEPVKEERS